MNRLWQYLLAAGGIFSAIAAIFYRGKKSGEDSQKLKQQEQTNAQQAKQRSLDDQARTLAVNARRRDPSDRSGLLEFARDDNDRDAGKEDQSDS